MTRPIAKLVIETDSRHKLAISEALFALGAGCVEEQGTRRKPTLIVYAPTEEEATALGARLSEATAATLPARAMTVRVERVDSNWENAWTEYLEPVPITEHFVLQPVSDDTPAPSGMQRILFEPKLAFGDGGHATTRLAARAVEQFCRSSPNARVLDYGSGTGVLALVSVLSGASQAVGVDIDPVAVAAAQKNAELNNVSQLCVFQHSDAALSETFDLVVANIETNVLLGLVPRLVEVARSARQLVLTGFLSDQLGDVAAAFMAQGFAPLDGESEDDWALLRLAQISRSEG